jgi:hypothetical protein
VEPRHPDIDHEARRGAKKLRHQLRLLGDREIGRPSGEDEQVPANGGDGSREGEDAGSGTPFRGDPSLGGESPQRSGPSRRETSDDDTALTIVEEVLNDGHDLGTGLARRIHELQLPLAEPAVVIDSGETEVGEWESLERLEAIGNRQVPTGNACQKQRQPALVGSGATGRPIGATASD